MKLNQASLTKLHNRPPIFGLTRQGTFNIFQRDDMEAPCGILLKS